MLRAEQAICRIDRLPYIRIGEELGGGKKLDPSIRLKMKGDTFFLPANGGVYFRNNISSFHVEGKTIYQWIEKLTPMFTGEHTLEELTDGLPMEYQNRIYEIASILEKNDFSRDISQDKDHQLSSDIVSKYGSQIAFIDNFCDSASYRFQCYRQTKVLAIGSGPIFVSLVSALLDSGLPNFHIIISDSLPTNRSRLVVLETHAQKSDPEVKITEITAHQAASWQETIKAFDSILYVSQTGNIEELRKLHNLCRSEKKRFIPAIGFQHIGLAGPLIQPDADICWESTWRRLHQTALHKNSSRDTFPFTAGAMLANVVVFEHFKRVTGVSKPDDKSPFFLLDLETLEGNWHTILPHPSVVNMEPIQSIFSYELLQPPTNNQSKLLSFFHQITSETSGIFHTWGAEDLPQLPLAQCMVQVADPLSTEPTKLLPSITCAALTHEEARREAGLTGIETYITRMVETKSLQDQLPNKKYIGIGAGESIAEGVCRGLQTYLAKQITPPLIPVQLEKVEDKHCLFYLQALTTKAGEPSIYLGELVEGFPVLWVRSDGGWHGAVGINETMALQKALLISLTQTGLTLTNLSFNDAKQNLVIPANNRSQENYLQSALQHLSQQNKQLQVYDFTLESWLKQGLAGVYGVVLREEEAQ